MIPKEIIEENSVSYAKKFNIALDKDPFPWFLLSVLFGARISEKIACNTFAIFKSKRLLSPYPSFIVREAAKNLNIDLYTYYIQENINYNTLESFLVKIGKNCIKNNCENCIVKIYCVKFKS